MPFFKKLNILILFSLLISGTYLLFPHNVIAQVSCSWVSTDCSEDSPWMQPWEDSICCNGNCILKKGAPKSCITACLNKPGLCCNKAQKLCMSTNGATYECYDPTKSNCINGQVTKPCSVGYLPCGTTCMPEIKICVNGKPECKPGSQECGQTCYIPTTHGCCNGQPYDLKTHGCCNRQIYDLQIHGCCDNKLINVPGPCHCKCNENNFQINCDENLNEGGPNRCSSACDCSIGRSCTASGWCQNS